MVRGSAQPIKRFAVPIGAIAAIAVLVLVVVGAPHVLSRAPAGAPTPVSLLWQAGVLPTGMQVSLTQPALATAFDEGKTAYACVLPADKPEAAAEIWITHDQASHWMRLSSLPMANIAVQGCWITLDALNPAVALAVVTSVPAFGGLRLDQTATYATADGGVTWRPLSDPHSFETKSLATWRNITYANRCCIPSNTPAFGLVASSDGLRTWQPIDQAITRAGEHVGDFWVRPDTGEVLAAAWNRTTDARHLWRTQDGGQHWIQLTTPLATYFVVQRPVASQPWHICGVRDDPTQDSVAQTAEALLCSKDGGQRWVSRAVPRAQTYVFAYTRAGDLLAQDSLLGLTWLARLTPTSDTWQSLGTVPGSLRLYAAYVAAPGAGALWALPLIQAPTDVGDAQIYGATYPGVS